MKRLSLIILLALAACAKSPSEEPFVRINCWLPNGSTISQVVTQEIYKKLRFTGIACLFEETATLPQRPQSTPEPTASPEPSPEATKRAG